MLPNQEENNFTLENIVSSMVVQSYSSESANYCIYCNNNKGREINSYIFPSCGMCLLCCLQMTNKRLS